MDVKEAIEKRRAYRSFEEIKITDNVINTFVRAAQVAPSCMNKQPWKFIFVKNKDKLENLYTALTPANKWAHKSSLIIGVVSTPKDDCIIGERLYYLFDTGMATAFIIL